MHAKPRHGAADCRRNRRCSSNQILAEYSQTSGRCKGRIMTRTALIALMLATPAQSATVQLDPGDMGVHWVAGVGFRPVDGIDTLAGKYACPRVGRAWKNTATDRVMRDVRCDEPLSGGVTWGLAAGSSYAALVWSSA